MRRCRWTTHRCASRTSRALASSLAGSRRFSSRRDCAGCSARWGGSRSLRSRIGVIAAGLVLAAGLGVPAAGAARHMLVGIQDDAQTVYGNPVTTFPLLRQLRTQIVRINLIWGGAPHGVADRRPAHPQDPSDPAYDWTVYDRAIRYANQNNIRVLLTILF